VVEGSRREQEFRLAEETQKSLLPCCVPPFENYRIHAYNVPTRYVGGDFYDFLQLNSGNWMGVLADVSGKGMSAALLSSMVLGALSMEFHSGTPAQDVLTRVNRLLCEKSLPGQFVTLFLFLQNTQGMGQFISAGHNPAYVFRAATGKIQKLFSEAFFLGMFEEAAFESRPFQLAVGDILVVISDGVTDAQNPTGQMFGEPRLLQVIRHEAPSGGQAIEKKLLRAIEAFTQGTAQNDDITFVAVEKYQ
jgi:sigma-B regulation protein RsbU (phosphoserine phosphatase)